MDRDRIDGTTRKAGGHDGQYIGDAIGDDEIGDQGALDHALGTVQDGYGRVRDKVLDLIDDAPVAAREAVATGRDYYRRGSAAVTRTASDNTALAMLVAGVALTAVSWLLFGRRQGTADK